MSRSVEIKEGAFIVSDAHYSHLRPDFLDFLKDIYSKKLKPTQLILMGDIFDTLFGGVPYTSKINKEAVNLINHISSDIEVIYLEGNHDFNLSTIFSHVKIFPISQQPLACKYGVKTVMLAHGDFGSEFKYRLYVSLIRSPIVLFILNMVNFLSFNLIIKKLDKYLSKKDDCKEFTGFKEFIYEKLHNKYECDYFIEGHFHQNKSFKIDGFNYINLAAFACNQRYFSVKSLKEMDILEENIFSKGI